MHKSRRHCPYEDMSVILELGQMVSSLHPADVQTAATVAIAHAFTLVGWGLRLRWLARRDRRDRENLRVILNELPAGSHLEVIRKDGSVLRIALAQNAPSVNDHPEQ